MPSAVIAYDSSVQKDDRIIEWIASKRNLPEDLGPKWLEVLMSAVRNEFPSLDTTVLGDSEIHQRLEAMYARSLPAKS